MNSNHSHDDATHQSSTHSRYYQIHFYSSCNYFQVSENGIPADMDPTVIKVQRGMDRRKQLRTSRSAPNIISKSMLMPTRRFCKLTILSLHNGPSSIIESIYTTSRPPDTFDRTLVLAYITRSIFFIRRFYYGTFELDCYKAARAASIAPNWIGNSDLLARTFFLRGLEGKTHFGPHSIYFWSVHFFPI